MSLNNELFNWWITFDTKAKGYCDLLTQHPLLCEQIQEHFNLNYHQSPFYLVSKTNIHNFDTKLSKCLPLSILPGAIENQSSRVILNRNYGTLIFRKDLTSKTLSQIDFTKNFYTQKPSSKEFCYPSLTIKTQKERIFTPFEEFPSAKSDTNLFISRVPQNYHSIDARIIEWIDSHNSIWCAGLESLKKLVNLKINVTGCVDSLGQQELNTDFIQQLFGKKWLTLTYQSNHKVNDKPNHFAWYSVISNLNKEALLNKTHFYWMGISEFTEALNYFPDLTNKIHACGLGTTYDYLSNIIDKKNLEPFYSKKHWEEQIL